MTKDTRAKMAASAEEMDADAASVSELFKSVNFFVNP